MSVWEGRATTYLKAEGPDLSTFSVHVQPPHHPGPPILLESDMQNMEGEMGAKNRSSHLVSGRYDFCYPHTLSGASSTIHSTVSKIVTS